MVNTPNIPSELRNLAKAHLLAKSTFNRAYTRFWENEVAPCPEEVGWKLLDVFRKVVEEYRFKLNRREVGIKHASWEMFRRELVDQDGYHFHELVGFVKWYRLLTSKVSAAIGHLYEYHGDSFSDLVDSYPLAGRELVERAFASHPKSSRPRREGFLDEREVGNAVLEKWGSQWHKLICEGENYVVTSLEIACYKSFLQKIVSLDDDQNSWTEDEVPTLRFSGHFDE